MTTKRWNGLQKDEALKAIQNAHPEPPVKQELGGGFYYKCHWIACGESLKRWWAYCPICGQKILWDEEL